jgi:hypothetical protein
LDSKVDPEWSMIRENDAVGKVRLNSLRVRKRTWYRTPLRNYLFAKLSVKGDGTLIVGRLGRGHRRFDHAGTHEAFIRHRVLDYGHPTSYASYT